MSISTVDVRCSEAFRSWSSFRLRSFEDLGGAWAMPRVSYEARFADYLLNALLCSFTFRRKSARVYSAAVLRQALMAHLHDPGESWEVKVRRLCLFDLPSSGPEAAAYILRQGPFGPGPDDELAIPAQRQEAE